MTHSQFHLFATRRFAPLFVVQAFGAFNDNAFKYGLSVFITYKLANTQGLDAATIIAAAAGLFIAPFFIFSALAGQLADKFDKAKLTRHIKLAEVVIMTLGGISLWSEWVALQLAVVFLTGAQSTFFGPIKYGILPQHLKSDELIGGNALIEAGTFLSILLGTLFGGFAMALDNGAMVIAAATIALALAGWAASMLMPTAPPPDAGIRLEYNIFAGTARIMGYARRRADVFLAILGISWFWALGIIFLTEIPAFAKSTLNGGESVANLFVITFTIGIGIGSLLNNWLLKGEVSPKYVPFASIATTVAIVDLWWASGSAAFAGGGGGLVGAQRFLTSFAGWRVLVDLALIALFGGLFVVPLFALVQARSSKRAVSRVIASNNVINAAFMTAATLATIVLLKAGLSIRQLFLLTGAANAAVAVIVLRLLPQDFIKQLGRAVFRLLYRVEVKGLDNYRAAGRRAVIVANHASFLDGPLLGSFLPDHVCFAINSQQAETWWVRAAAKVFELLPIDPTNPLAARAMIRALKKNRKVMIFPEGRITVTGALMKVYEGPGLIANLAGAKVLPVRIDGAQNSLFSRLRGKQRLRLFPKITITFLEPQDFSTDKEIKGNALREMLANRLYDVMSSMVFRTSKFDQTLLEALFDAISVHGRKKPIVEDIQRQPITYSRLLTGTFVLGRKLSRMTANEGTVGVLLPNAAGCLVTLFALHAFGKVPAMLNFSTGAVNMVAACAAAEVKTVITSRRFIEQGGLEEAIDLISRQCRVIYLEDVRERLGAGDKIKGLAMKLLGRRALAMSGAESNPRSPAVILFTSGSEGLPKGVVLSHRNILANIRQVAARIDFNASDRVFNALPMFHAFGLTVGTLLPVFYGIREFLYPSPLHYKIVPELVYDTDTTIMFGTDTFLTGYARNAHPYDFYSVRLLVAGAERVRPETRAVWMEKFGKRIIEGYGATECSPVLSANTPMHFKSGSVGRLFDGIEHRLEPVEGIAEGGKLVVRGPNVMLGYLRADEPGRLEPPEDGWYDTGDIVTIDDLGFVTIQGRAKRFAKIGGEMVSLGAVENHVNTLFKDHDHAVVAVPDARKGERLVVMTTMKSLDRKQLSTGFKKLGAPGLMVPAAVIKVSELPVLGTGKTDYVTINKMAREAAAKE